MSDLEKRLKAVESELETLKAWQYRNAGYGFKLGPPYEGNDVQVIFESGSSLLNPPGQFVQLPDLSSRAFVRVGYVDDEGHYQNSGWQDWPYVLRNNVPGANGWQIYAGTCVAAGAWIEFNPAGVANALELPFQRLVSVEFGTILPLEKQDGTGLLLKVDESQKYVAARSVGAPKESEQTPILVATIQMRNCKAPNSVAQEKLLPDDTVACFVSASWWQPEQGAARQCSVDWLEYHNTYFRKSTGNMHLEYSERTLVYDFAIPEDAINISFRFGVLKHKSAQENTVPYPHGIFRR